MATTTPFAYNPSLSPISGTTQVGQLAVGTTNQDYSISPGGVTWWMGPDEDLGYVIAVPVSGNTQPTEISGVSASVGFFRSEDLTDNSFIGIAEYVANEYGSPQTFTSASDASDWLTNNGFWNTFIPVTPTPTPTNGVTQTPTNTPTNTPTPTPTATNTPTPSPTNTPTPTPTTSPIPVTGFGYNLVVLPYNPPTSGNTIFPTFATPGLNSGTTNPNTFDVNGIYWNIIDNSSVDRTSYYSGMTGVSVTAYFTQNSNTVIYSGSPTAFIFDIAAGGGFNYNPGARPGQLTLIQSAPTNFVTGQTVYISYIVN
jgi:hypothetical protein